MSQCQSGSDTYLNYDCYELLKSKFDNFNLGSYGPEYLGKAREQIKKKYPNELDRYKICFENITSYLQHDNVFFYADWRIPCRYINYLLNKKLRELDMHSSNANYGILQDFVKEYHISKGYSKYADICSLQIKSLDDKVYHKMTLLYQLYNDYITLVKTKKTEKYDPCVILSMIILNYNNSIDSYQKTDEELINKLINLKKLIDRKVLPNNKVCQKEITYFNLSKKEIDEQQRLAEEQERREQAKRLEQEKLEQAKRLEQEKLEQEKLEQAKQLGQGQLERVELQEHLQTIPVRPESNQQRQQYRVPYTQDPYLPHIQESDLGGSYKVSKSFGESEHSEIKMEQSQDQDVLGQMQNAFSSIVRNVDPAPVLGVSGGMGVLFVLFKYTPFGSLFGGRRGRIRQIPSSFRGFPPGDFANFQEYDGGFIGYGPMNISPLAE